MTLVKRERRIDSSIDLTPLIDVVFQLLIFLMVSSQFTKPESMVELPQTKEEASPVDPQPDRLAIVIQKDGQVMLDGETVSLETFGEAVEKRIAATGNTRAEVRGDRLAHYGIFVEVMVTAKAHGVESLGIVQKPKGEGSNE